MEDEGKHWNPVVMQYGAFIWLERGLSNGVKLIMFLVTMLLFVQLVKELIRF